MIEEFKKLFARLIGTHSALLVPITDSGLHVELEPLVENQYRAD